MDSAATLPAASRTPPAERRTTAATALAALGIVYGDLGTSPLYTYQTIVSSVGGHPSVTDAMGLLSLVAWALIVTISLKYCVFVMRADNNGEGGILALMSLVTRGRTGGGPSVLVAMGLFGAALIYGDGIITPAISVLSALEGVNVVTEAFRPYTMPAALAVLLALFLAQSRGTATIGRIFGPVMLVWFITIARLKGSLETRQAIWEVKGKPLWNEKQVLADYLENHRPKDKDAPTDVVFVSSKHDGPLCREAWNRIFKAYAKEAGLPAKYLIRNIGLESPD